MVKQVKCGYPYLQTWTTKNAKWVKNLTDADLDKTTLESNLLECLKVHHKTLLILKAQ